MADFAARQPVNGPPPDDHPLSERASSETPAVLGYIAACAMIAIATGAAVGIDSRMKIPNLSLLFVVPVIIAALRFGLGPSVCAAILGPLAYNFFLTEPRYTMAVNDPVNMWAIALLFAIGLVVSTVAFTSRRRATEAARLRRQVNVLHHYNHDVVAANDIQAIVSITSHALAALFHATVVLMLVAEDKVVCLERVGEMQLQGAEIEAARSSLATQTVVHAGVYPDVTSRFDFWPVATTAGSSAVIGLAFDPDERPSTPGELVDIVRDVLALVLQREHFRLAGRDAR